MRDKRVFLAGVMGLMLLLSGCIPDLGRSGGESDSLSTPNSANLPSNNSNITPAATISGSVGDGPIINADIKCTDSRGAFLGSAVSSTTASYTINLPQNTAYPVLVKATGGTDTVTGTEPDFTMVSVATDSSANTVNINPFSTLIVKTAQAMPGGLTTANLLAAKLNIAEQLNFGLDPGLVSDPITTPVNETNVAAIIKASETFGEAVRRTRSTLLVSGTNYTGDDIINAIAGDMTDGVMDGRGPGANVQIAATANIVAGQVLVEALVNQLYVNGADATTGMDIAINLSMPSATMTTADVVITDGMLIQTKTAVAAAQAHSPSSDLSTTAVILSSLSGNSLAADIETVLPINPGASFNEVIAQVPFSTGSQLDSVNATLRSGSTAVYPPATQFTSVSKPSTSRPGYLQVMTDPTFATEIIRVSDDAVFGKTNVRHHYAKDGAWNANGTLIKMENWILEGTGKSDNALGIAPYGIWRTYSRPSEHRWSHIDPYKMFGVVSRQFVSVDVRTNVRTTLRSFTGYDKCQLGPYEGNISNDDRYVALACQRGSDFVAVVYNIETDTIEATRTFAGQWNRFDWISMSQSGLYVVINWTSSAGKGAVTSYDRNLNKVVDTSPRGEHGDLCLDAQGNDVWVQVIPGIQSWRLDNGVQTALLPALREGGHVSCRNIKRPGWAYISTGANANLKQVFSVKLDGSQTVERFAHHNSEYYVYADGAQGVPSPDGSRVMFASNWGQSNRRNSFIARAP